MKNLHITIQTMKLWMHLLEVRGKSRISTTPFLFSTVLGAVCCVKDKREIKGKNNRN